jgi:hypothetical protein
MKPATIWSSAPTGKAITPAGIKKVFRSTTPFALTIFRTQLFNAADMPNVEKVQAGYKAQPLSAFLKQPAPPAAPKIDFLPATTAGIKTNFYEYLDAALQFVPAARGTSDPRQARQHRHRARQDLRVQGPFAGAQGRRPAGDEGRRRQGREVSEARAEGDQRLEGRSLFGDRAFYNGDWLKRAAAAKGGIYGNDAVEAMYPMTASTSTARRSMAASTTTR